MKTIDFDEIGEPIQLGAWDDFKSAAATGAGTVAGIGGALLTHNEIQRHGGYRVVTNKGIKAVKETAGKLGKKIKGVRLSSRDQLNSILQFDQQEPQGMLPRISPFAWIKARRIAYQEPQGALQVNVVDPNNIQRSSVASVTGDEGGDYSEGLGLPDMRPNPRMSGVKMSAREELGAIINFKAHGGYEARLQGGYIADDASSGGLTYKGEKVPGVGSHFKRAAGKYIGTAAGLGLTGHGGGAALGLLGGALVDSARAQRNVGKSAMDRAPQDVATVHQNFVDYKKKLAEEQGGEKRMSAILNRINFEIKIDPKNRGKFGKTEERTGKSAEELKHSKNPLTRKRATFAENAKHWKKGGKEHKMSARETLGSIIQLKALDLAEDQSCYGPSEMERRKYYPSLHINDRPEEVDLPLEGKATVRYKLRSKEMRQNEKGEKRHSASIEIQSIDPIKEDKKKDGAKQLKISPTSPMTAFSVRDQLNEIINFGAGDKYREAWDGFKTASKSTRGKIMNGAAHRQYKLGGQLAPPRTARELRRVGKGPSLSAIGSTIQFQDFDDIGERIMFDNRPRNPLGEFSGAEEGPSANAIASVYKQGNVGKDIAVGAAGSVAGAGALSGIQHLANKIKKARRV